MFINNITSRCTILIALIISIAGTIAGQQPRPASTSSNRSQQAPKDAGTAFRNARDSITDGEWAKAQEMFSDYVAKYPNEKNIDAALY